MQNYENKNLDYIHMAQLVNRKQGIVYTFVIQSTSRSAGLIRGEAPEPWS